MMKTIEPTEIRPGVDLHARADLVREGVPDRAIYRHLCSGEWERVRAGVYALSSGLEGLFPSERHRLTVAATAPVLAPTTVISHVSAAVIHGLPLWRAPFKRVHVTHSASSGGRRSARLHSHAAILTAEDVTVVGDVPVTKPGLTVVDCARMLSFEQGVVMADAALRMGLTTVDELVDLVRRAARRKGISRARAVVAFADGRSESPGESRSRVVLARTGLPSMELQYEIHDENGELVARVDFAIPELRIAGEFDGKVKYGRLLRPDQEPGDAVFKEKRREDAVRDVDWQMVRWTWSDLETPLDVSRRWERAIARSQGATGRM